ncbi:hypothetical protein C0036_12715, partial [Streptomyces sp. DJ]
KVAFVGRSMVRNMGIARDLGGRRVTGGRRPARGGVRTRSSASTTGRRTPSPPRRRGCGSRS